MLVRTGEEKNLGFGLAHHKGFLLLSGSNALYFSLPNRYFINMGLPAISSRVTK